MVDFMKRALELASEALSAQEVPVGCVFTINSEIIAESRNSVNATHNPTRHAEINCIDTVIAHCKNNHIDYKMYFKNVTVYVTVEPCIMCAAALSNLCVKEVIYGCANDRFGGKTVLDISKFYEYNYNLTGNLMANEAMALLKQFYKGTNPNAPEPKTKKEKV
ncbi:tRNA-specific adenosine deaminase 2 [Trichoplusia ni]|uniref:tRNA-specific adenosine deaminase 2 n=1 Tax=Trichoplusia ni TaxID=7111 RepID=A0A7E5W338_TRINI|nr:tRNA-specific adenosine deaminase 2 [Trichoplusia ni]